MNIKRNEVKIPEEFKQTSPHAQAVTRPAPEPPKAPDFVPATEDVSPIKTRIVDITARKTPLRDVLHVIAEATSLNLVMEKGVDPETEVNLTLKNVTAEYALNTIFSAVDYFYKVEENLLIVKASDTKAFELGHPAMTQAYTVDVGGDILGGAMDINPSGSGSGGSSTAMKGNITQSIKGDDIAFKFWDAVEKSVQTILGGQSGGSAQAGPEQSVTINRLSGTIYVTATKKNLQKVEEYLKTVRKAIGRQVLIEAKVIEVQLTDDFQFGIDWTMVDRYITSTDTGSRTTSSFTASTSKFTSAVTSAGPIFAITGAPSFGGAKADLSFVLNALQQQGDVRTLSNPKLNIMNGQTAMLSVGRNQAYISKVESTISASGGAQTITYTVTTNSILSGTMIGILPYISENGEISLTITPIVSNLVKLTPQTIGSTSTTAVVDIQLPTTTVKVRNGDIIAIGGLISKDEKQVDNQVPFLGNLPFIGYLFKSRDKQEHKIELVVIIQPILVNM
jgi:MSHA type pilus biogenesis protein MshL